MKEINPVSTASKIRVTLGMQLVFVLLSYFVSWGFLLMMLDAIFWDDWVFVNDPIAVTNHFQQAGAPWSAWFHSFFEYSTPTYRLMTFCSFLLASLCFLGILRKLPEFLKFSPEQILFASIAFATAPLNMARVSGITVIYSLSFACFFLAWYLWINTKSGSVFVTSLVVALFSLSFFTNSFLVFFAAPFLHKLAIDKSRGELRNWRTVVTRGLAYGSLPFIWFGAFLSAKPKPFGFYDGYNSIGISWVLIFVLSLILILSYGLVWFGYFSQERQGGARTETSAKYLAQLGLGLFLITVGLFPYLAVGHIPPYSEWMTRDELLLPAGVGIVLAAIFGALKKVWVLYGYSLAGILLFVSLTAAVNNGIAALVDWEKQKFLIQHWSSSSRIYSSDLVVIADESQSLNLFGREYRFYEWAGQLRDSTGPEGPYAISNSESDWSKLQTGYLESYATLGSGPRPQLSKEYLYVTIQSRCDGPMDAINTGVENCLFIEEKALPAN